MKKNANYYFKTSQTETKKPLKKIIVVKFTQRNCESFHRLKSGTYSFDT
jgi:hypothetical protein